MLQIPYEYKDLDYFLESPYLLLRVSDETKFNKEN